MPVTLGKRERRWQRPGITEKEWLNTVEDVLALRHRGDL